jgi:hypothetical protein
MTVKENRGQRQKNKGKGIFKGGVDGGHLTAEGFVQLSAMRYMSRE